MANARVMISHAGGQGRRELSSAHFLRHPAKGVTGFRLVSLVTVLSAVTQRPREGFRKGSPGSSDRQRQNTKPKEHGRLTVTEHDLSACRQCPREQPQTMTYREARDARGLGGNAYGEQGRGGQSPIQQGHSSPHTVWSPHSVAIPRHRPSLGPTNSSSESPLTGYAASP